MRAQVDERGWLKRRPGSPASALDGDLLLFDGDFTPDGYSVNTTQPPYQPSRVPPAKGGDPTRHRSGEVHAAAADAEDDRRHADRQGRLVGVVFRRLGRRDERRHAAAREQARGHLQPRQRARSISRRITSPSTISRATRRERRIARSTSRITTISSPASTRGNLPQVAFYKPQGTLNQHPGYTDVQSGDVHIAELLAKIKASPLWASTVDHRDLRRERRLLGSCAAAQGRPLGTGHAHSRDHRVAVREEGLRRPHAVRHDVDHQVDHAALRPRAVARRTSGRGRSHHRARFAR